MTQSHPNESQETIIRFSGSWWAYIVFRLGFLRAFVNGIEDALAITGRFLLLVFLIYCGAQAGLLLSNPNFSFPSWVEMGMFILQLAGLEGSIPGLARQGDTLRTQGDETSAKKVDGVMLSARIMTVLAIAEGALHALHVPPMFLQIISAILLIVRGIVITGFLIALAKMESKAPRVLSKDAHARELTQQAQRDKQAQVIDDLQGQLQQVQQNLIDASEKHDALTQQVNTAEKQAQVASQLQAQLDQTNQKQAFVLADLQAQLSQAETAKHHLSALLERAERQICDLTAQRETANLQIAHLQHAERDAANLQTAQPAKKRSAKAMQTLDPNNITPINHARVKHDAGSGKTKMSHADVVAFMATNPSLKRAEVAAQLGISERKVYDALAWAKEQEHALSARESL